MKVLVIIPAYNEEESILKTVQSILDFREQRQLNFVLDYIVIIEQRRFWIVIISMPFT